MIRAAIVLVYKEFKATRFKWQKAGKAMVKIVRGKAQTTKARSLEH